MEGVKIMPNKHLATYLNDHLAGSETAVELLRHLLVIERVADRRAQLQQLSLDVEKDRLTLKQIMQKAHISESDPRKAAGWFANKAAQIKLRLDDPDSGDLYRLESLEALVIGIEGKSALWRALRETQIGVGNDLVDFDELERRAKSQSTIIDRMRLEAAKGALAG
jgi:hypothetical protein